MEIAQDYVLVIGALTGMISALAGLLALGVPPIVSALDARRARRAARKKEMERLLFNVLDNYRNQRFELHNFLSKASAALRRGQELPTDTVDEISVEGFQQAIPRLKALAALHRIDDAGFFAVVEAYLTLTLADVTPGHTGSNNALRQFSSYTERLAELESQIQTATAAFLTNIATHFG